MTFISQWLEQQLPALWKASHQEGQKRTLDLLKLKLQTVKTHHVSSGTEPRSSERIINALDCRTISPAFPASTTFSVGVGEGGTGTL